MQKSIILILGIAFVGVGCVTGNIEEPKFQVVSKEGEFEVRAYEPKIVAETIVTGGFSDAPTAGFRILADYIFGNNKAKAKIAMTAPVSQEEQGETIAMTAPVAQEKLKGSDDVSSWRISFTMPSSYSMQNLPSPNNDKVTLRQLPAERFAAIRFSGWNSKKTVEEKTSLLRNWIEKNGLEEKKLEPVYARYNPPWTPWFLRRNEILIAIE